MVALFFQNCCQPMRLLIRLTTYLYCYVQSKKLLITGLKFSKIVADASVSRVQIPVSPSSKHSKIWVCWLACGLVKLL